MANKQTILRFRVRSPDLSKDMFSRFFPMGHTVLNRTEWMGKEPRSCGVTGISSEPHHSGSPEVIWYIEVSYRPKGCVNFVGDTKYDGWTAMILDRTKDGTLLDGHGKPLPEGQEPVYRPYEMYRDVDFNEIDFGEFLGEEEVGIKHLGFDQVMKRIHEAPQVSGSIYTTFMAPRKHRPLVKILLSNAPSGVDIDGFGTRIVLVNNLTPHLRQVVLDHLTELLSGFVEGRYSIKNLSTNDSVFAELDDVLVDATPNEEGKQSRFGILHEYVSEKEIEELAIRLMAIYEVDVAIVDGPKGGLLLQRREPQRRKWGKPESV